MAEAGARLIGKSMFDKYNRWPVYSKFFDNMGPIPHHMHQRFEDAKLVGQEGKPESYYFRPQYNNCDNNFAYTFMGLEPGTTKAQVRKLPGKLEQGRQRHSRSVARFPPEARHRLADSARCAARPRFALHLRAAVGQRCVRHVSIDRRRPLRALVAVGQGHAGQTSTRISISSSASSIGKRTSIRTSRNTITSSRSSPRKEWAGPTSGSCTATIDGEQLFSAKELTLEPGAKCTIKDSGASGWITVQGTGRMGKLNLQTPAMIRFGEETEDEVFISHEAATRGVEIENTGSEPLVGLRYFGPDVHKILPKVGDYRK